YFVNPIVSRIDVSDRPSFAELLARVRDDGHAALAAADYPFPLLVEQLHPAREPDRSPLFQLLFSLDRPRRVADRAVAALIHGQPAAALRIGDVTLEPRDLDIGVAQFDLALRAVDFGDSLAGTFEYDTALFEAATIVRMADHFVQLLRSIVASPGRR